ncbi:MAG: hypothetical protein IKO74_08630 [Selenomonadaceae bacterium]|nr:hypothetical protein [Selenomonadaceae bacterium]
MKNFSRKGQGLVEYALLLGFVAAIALFVTINGGFGATIKNLFGTAGDNVETAGNNILNTNESESEETSFDYETQTEESDAAPSYKTLNWQMEIVPFADMTYNTIVNSDTVDKALSSEIGFFNTLFSAIEGYLASTKAEDGTKDWESFLTMIDNTKAKNNFNSTYVRDEQKITIKRTGNGLRVTYSDKEGLYYYTLSPDANNVMQVETNSNKSYSQFFSTIIRNADGGGWKYSG